MDSLVAQIAFSRVDLSLLFPKICVKIGGVEFLWFSATFESLDLISSSLDKSSILKALKILLLMYSGEYC